MILKDPWLANSVTRKCIKISPNYCKKVAKNAKKPPNINFFPWPQLTHESEFLGLNPLPLVGELLIKETIFPYGQHNDTVGRTINHCSMFEGLNPAAAATG